MGPRIEDGEKLKKEHRQEVQKKLRKKQEGKNTDFKRQKPQGNQQKLQRNTDIKKRLLERLQKLQHENSDSTRKQLQNLQHGIMDFNRRQIGNMWQQRLLLTRLGNIDFNRAELERQRQLLEKVGSEECDMHVEDLMKKKREKLEMKIEVDEKMGKNDGRLSKIGKPEVVSRRRLDGESILFEVTPSASPAQMEIIEEVVKRVIERVVKKMKFKEESEEVTLGMDKFSLG